MRWPVGYPLEYPNVDDNDGGGYYRCDALKRKDILGFAQLAGFVDVSIRLHVIGRLLQQGVER